MNIQTGANDRMTWADISEMSQFGTVVFRRDQKQSRIHVYNASDMNTTLLREKGYSEEFPEFDSRGRKNWCCQDCNYCLQFVDVTEEKPRPLFIWCSLNHTRVNPHGHCRLSAGKMSPIMICLGRRPYQGCDLGKMIEGKMDAKRINEADAVKIMNKLSTESGKFTPSAASNVNKSSSYEQAQDIVVQPPTVDTTSSGKSK